MRVWNDDMRTPGAVSAAMIGAMLLLVPSASATADATADLRSWFDRYRRGQVDLYAAVPTGVLVRGAGGDTAVAGARYYDDHALTEFRRLLERAITEGGLPAARVLLDAAVYRPAKDEADERDRFTNRQPWIVRREAARALATIGMIEDVSTGSGDGTRQPDNGQQIDRWLRTSVLRDTHPIRGDDKRAVAALALGRRHDETSTPALVALLDDPSVQVRSAAAEALGLLRNPATIPDLERALADDDPTVRLQALRSLQATVVGPADESGNEVLLRALFFALNDPEWTMRRAAAAALAEQRDPRCVPILVRALRREAPERDGSRRRVRAAIRDALGQLTGMDLPAGDPDQWEEWWQRVADDFLVNEDALVGVAPEQGARFFGIPLESDVVVFLLDVSGSMEQPASDDRLGPSRLHVASRELVRCLDSLENGTRFNIVLFNETLLPFRASPEPKSDASARQVREFLSPVDASGGTNLFGALEFALGLGNPELSRRVRGEELDTVVLLTDGVPSRGPVLIPEEIVHQVSMANRGMGIAVHTVTAGLGDDPFLRDLAARNNGESSSIRR